MPELTPRGRSPGGTSPLDFARDRLRLPDGSHLSPVRPACGANRQRRGERMNTRAAGGRATPFSRGRRRSRRQPAGDEVAAAGREWGAVAVAPPILPESIDPSVAELGGPWRCNRAQAELPCSGTIQPLPIASFAPLRLCAKLFARAPESQPALAHGGCRAARVCARSVPRSPRLRAACALQPTLARGVCPAAHACARAVACPKVADRRNQTQVRARAARRHPGAPPP